MGDFPCVRINGQGTTGKIKRAYLRAYNADGTVLPVAWVATYCLTLATISGNVCVGSTGMVEEGSCAFKEYTSAATGCGPSPPPSVALVFAPLSI